MGAAGVCTIIQRPGSRSSRLVRFVQTVLSLGHDKDSRRSGSSPLTPSQPGRRRPVSYPMAEARVFAAHPYEWRLLGPADTASCHFGPSLALRTGGVFPIVSRCLPQECLWFGSPCVPSAFSRRASPCQPGILVAKAESNGGHLLRWVFSCQCGGAAPHPCLKAGASAATISVTPRVKREAASRPLRPRGKEIGRGRAVSALTPPISDRPHPRKS
jgi:hypothetical protein